MNAEEEAIRSFVARIYHDERFRDEYSADPDGVLAREQLSPLVRTVIKRLHPPAMKEQLAEGKPLPVSSSFMQ